MSGRDVFHIRLRGLELQAERMIDPTLKTRPVAILSSNSPNGTIISISPEAKEEGLLKGMKVSTIRKINHGVRLLPYNKSLYTKINHYIYKMLFYCHRINTIEELKKIPTKYGIEIDLRDKENKIILVHDPFLDGEDFEEFLKYFNHQSIILNIKSEAFEYR